MPFLTFNSTNTQHVGLLTRRVLIGRQLPHGVVLADPNVSRLHAWLDAPNDQSTWFITDAGSKTGTFVNGKQVYRHQLSDGETIRIGEVQIVYHTADVPPNANAVDLSAPNGVIKVSGILFDCGNCGAPIWVASDLAGKRGLCRHCKKSVTVPDAPAVIEPAVQGAPPDASIAGPAPATKKELGRCAVCHGVIQPDDGSTTCPECAMHFHTECWQENFGCSSYGCPQVDILNPNPRTAAFAASATLTETSPIELEGVDAEPASHTPWETIALAGSVLASVLGAVMFGIPAALVAIWSIVLMVRGSRRKTMLTFALLICFVGIAGGLMVSDFYFYNAVHLPFKIRL